MSRGAVVIENDQYVGTQGSRSVRSARPVAVPRLGPLVADDRIRPRHDRGNRLDLPSRIEVRPRLSLLASVESRPSLTGSSTGEPHERISHWIDGKVVEGTSGRSGVVWNPATGEQQAEVDCASASEVDAAVAVAKAAFPAWRATNLSRRAEVMFQMRELVDANRKEIASLHQRRARQGARRRPRRGRPWPREHRVRVRHPQPAEGRLQRAGLAPASTCTRIRQPLGVVAGITPFNFPAMVPMWMFANALACGNTFVLKPSEKDPSASLFIGRAAQAGRSARRLLQRRPRRQGGRRPHPRAPRHRRGQLRRLDADRQVHLRDRHPQRQAGAGPRRRQEPHARAARRRPRHGRRRRGQRRATARPASAAWRSRVVARRRRDRRPAGRQDQGAHPDDQGRSRPASPTARWARSSPASTATRSPATSTAPRAKAQPWWSTVVDDAPGRRLLPRPLADRRRQAGHGLLRRRDLRTGAHRHAGRAATTKAST